MRPEELLCPSPAGLYCRPGGFHIDPVRPVERALVTHAHSDHARPGHGAVLATADTIDLMRLRLGDNFARTAQAVRYGEPVRLDGVTVRFHPAGHVLGSAQIAVEAQGIRIVASGDYKDVADPTCVPFEPLACDVFITEATFGLPVFRHGDAGAEIGKLLRSVALFPKLAHLVGAYALGKAQRVIALLRAAGHDRPIYLHGALEPITRYYRAPHRSRRVAAGARREQGRAYRCDRARPAFGPAGSLEPALSRPYHGLRVRLDAGAGARPPARRRTAAGDFRSCRLGWPHRHGYGNRRIRDLDHAWRRGRARALVRHTRPCRTPPATYRIWR
jgi:putative mRNA 3-end processing factor